MPLEHSITDEVLLEQLTEEQVRQVICQSLEAWDEGVRQRADKEAIWIKCWRAYTMYKDKALFAKQPWRTQVVVSWVYDTVESAVDDYADMLFPNEEDFFSVIPFNKGDDLEEANAEAMTSYLQRKLDEADYISNFRLFLKQLCIIGNSVLKHYWKTSERVVSKSQFDEATGQNIRARSIVTDFDGPVAEVINMQDFVQYPATGSIDESMCLHRVLRPVDIVKANALYVNTEELKADTGSANSITDNSLGRDIDKSLGIISSTSDKTNLVELIEVWGDFVIDGQRFRNYVATIARNQRLLLRFQPNPHDYGLKPFTFCGFRDVPNHAYAIGLVEPILDYQAMGSTISNMIFDEAKLKIHGQYKYVPDGVFDPDNFEARPGGTHAVSEIDNLQAINPNLNLNFGFAERNNLKGELEETTGITQFSKGANQTGKSRTARESVLLSQAGTKKATAIAKHVSRKTLVPSVKLFYALVKQFDDPLKIMEQTGMKPEELALMLPLDQTKFKITGLQTAIHKQTVIENMQTFVTGVLPTPIAHMLNWGEVGEDWYRAMGFSAKENLLLPEPLRLMIQEMLIAQTIGIMPPAGMLGGEQPGPSGQPGEGPDKEEEAPVDGQPPQQGTSMISGII